MRAAATRSTNPALTARTLTDGGQSAADVAGWIADFLDGAQETLDLAQYDFHLDGEAREIVTAAIGRAAGRGVRIRFVYNVDHRNPIPVPAPPVAAAFSKDFEQLWTRDDVESTGLVAPAWHGGIRAWFTPGHGEDLSHRIAKRISRARRRVRVCSPVITTAPVLATLAQAVAEGRLDLGGCVDRTQVQGVVHQWRLNGNVSWKLPLLERVMAGPFTGKVSTPWRAEGSVHDFMHAKITVADDTVFVGSFNLSRSGEQNAENVLEIEDGQLADELAGYIDGVRARYPPVDLASA